MEKVENNEFDAFGDLFRRKLEDHRMEVDSNGWDEIERRLGNNRNDKPATIWLWRMAAMVAAASIAALLFFKDSKIPEFQDPVHNADLVPASPLNEDHTVRHAEFISASPLNEDSVRHAEFISASPLNEEPVRHAEFISASPLNEEPVRHAEFISASPLNEEPVRHAEFISASPLNIDSINQLISNLFVDKEPDEEESNKWLLSAALGIGGYTNSIDPHTSSASQKSSSMVENSSGNRYAANLAGSVMSFDNMSKDDFTNISHNPPFSLGMTARSGGFEKNAGIEFGLVYTYLASRYNWSNHNVHQGLHYIGIPVNLFGYLGNPKPGNIWRVYFSGGFMVEKGLRAIYKQERTWESEIRTTTVKSSINGLQWSLNGGLGISRKLENGFGIYFEPRVGYSFDNNQPISIRTEWPVYVGVSFGLNYEL